MAVKRNKGKCPKNRITRLSRDLIMDCATELMRDTGKVPAIRSIARELEVDPMAIYYYFDNKTALLEALTLSLMGKICEEPMNKSDWQVNLKALCKNYLDILNEYSGLLETILSMEDTGPANIFNARFRSIIAQLNLPEISISAVLNLTADYLHGFAFAMHCNRGNSVLSSEGTIDPMDFLMRALEREASILSAH